MDTRPSAAVPPPPAPPAAEVTYRRNPEVLLEWAAGGGAVLVDCRRWRRFTVRPAVVALLTCLDGPRTAEALHERWQGLADPEETGRLLDRLAAAGLVRRYEAADPSLPGAGASAGTGTDAGTKAGAGTGVGAEGLTPYELAAHAQAGRGPVPHARRGDPPAARLRHPEAVATVPLTGRGDTGTPPSRPLAEVLAARRSERTYAPEPVPLPLLAALLDRSARVRGLLPPRSYEQTQRPAPSGGGRHSLEVYLLARDVAGLAPGAYHYDPFAHALDLLQPWDSALAELQRRTVTLPALLAEAPPAGLYLASHVARTGWKYEGLALSLVYRDTGCLMQTACLAATDLGLACCLTGTMETPVTAPFLGPHREGLLHVGNLALGLPPDGPAGAPAVEPLGGEAE